MPAGPVLREIAVARIRTIKPEFPQSESMGRVSREARLTFIQLWTLADDAGRLRGNSRMLAALLYPYDDDAPARIGSWLGELENEGCIHQYAHQGSQYLQICNWLNHQKIDKPSRSRLPACHERPDLFAAGHEDYGLGHSEEPEDVPEAAPAAPAGAEKAPRVSPSCQSPLQRACSITWQCYAEAYQVRYGTAPVRNARINAQIRQFVQRLGADAAPQVARFYLHHEAAAYVRGAHTVGLMLADAEKLHTEWAIGRPLSQSTPISPANVHAARQIAANTRLADLVSDDGTPRTITGSQDGHAARLVG